MALVGLKVYTDREGSEEMVGELRLNESDEVEAKPSGDSQMVVNLTEEGVEIYPADQSIAQDHGKEFNITMPKEEDKPRKYMPKDGPHFLVAVITMFHRGSYSWVEPIEE